MSATSKKIPRAHEQMIRSAERYKLEQIAHADKIRRRSNIMGLGLFAFVVGVYVYTIRRMGQDSFLDDNEPMIKQR